MRRQSPLRKAPGRQRGRRRIRAGLIAGKKERAVANDWSANNSAKVIVLKFVSLYFKKVSRVEVIVAQELVGRAVKIVCPRFDEDIEFRTGVSSVLGSTLRLNIELAQRIDGAAMEQSKEILGLRCQE